MSSYLAQPRYQKRPHLEKVLPAARRLIRESRVITLIFIFDGSETMQGTGFDKDINDLQKESGRRMRADNIPFVTVLAARDGNVFDYRVRTPVLRLPAADRRFLQTRRNQRRSTVAAITPPPPAVAPPKPPEPRHIEIVLRPTRRQYQPAACRARCHAGTRRAPETRASRPARPSVRRSRSGRTSQSSCRHSRG